MLGTSRWRLRPDAEQRRRELVVCVMELIDGRGKKLVVDPLISSFGGLQSGSAENLTDERRCSAFGSGDKPSQVPNVEVQPLAIELEQAPAPVCVRKRHRDSEVHPTGPGRQRWTRSPQAGLW